MPTETSIPVAWILLCALLVMGTVALMAWRGAERPKGEPRFALKTWLLGTGLFALGWLLRHYLGPHSFLHENFYGPRLAEAIVSGADAVRPMGGTVGLHRLLDVVSAPAIDRIFAVNIFFGALQAPLVLWLLRLLNVRSLAATVGALLVASLPLLIRTSASDIAFVPAATFLILGACGAVMAHRSGQGSWFVFSLAAVAIAGHFRPVTYVAALPVLLAPVMLPGGVGWRDVLRWRGLYVGCGVFGLLIFGDLMAILNALGEGTALSPGWWQGTRWHDWPLLDPSLTPVWVPLGALAAVVMTWGRRNERMRTAWALVFLLLVSFLLSARNGWPASVRYATSYAWLLPLLIALGVDAIDSDRVRRGVAVCFMVGAVLTPWLYQAPIGRHFAEQEEVRFQRQQLMPQLADLADGVILTPWPDLKQVGGSFFAHEAVRLGHSVAPFNDVLSVKQSKGPRYYYRGLTCWTRIPGREKSDRRGQPATNRCAFIETQFTLKPLLTTSIAPANGTDWMQIGNEEDPVEVGLFGIESSRE